MDIDGTPFSASVFSITPVSTFFVLSRSNRPFCAIAVDRGRRRSTITLSWRRYLRVIVVPSEGWAELGGGGGARQTTVRRVHRQAAGAVQLQWTADDGTVVRGARESPNAVPT